MNYQDYEFARQYHQDLLKVASHSRMEKLAQNTTRAIHCQVCIILGDALISLGLRLRQSAQPCEEYAFAKSPR